MQEDDEVDSDFSDLVSQVNDEQEADEDEGEEDGVEEQHIWDDDDDEQVESLQPSEELDEEIDLVVEQLAVIVRLEVTSLSFNFITATRTPCGSKKPAKLIHSWQGLELQEYHMD